MKGRVFNIQRFSLSDGPGIRTTVFLSGCPLRCRWCHNPEAFSLGQRLRLMRDKCIGCGKCFEVCETGARKSENEFGLDRKKCIACGKCVSVCPSQALTLTQTEYDTDKLVSEIVRDLAFYGDDGGVTFSGGEPLLQPAFITDVAKKAKFAGVPTVAVDTAGDVPWENFCKVLDTTDLFLYDIKAFDSELHKKGTGVSNDLIFSNLNRLDETGKDIWIRIPIVCGFNDTEDEIEKIAQYVHTKKNVKRTTLIPFHTLGKEKYSSLGYECGMNGFGVPSEERIKQYEKLFNMRG